MLKTIIMACLAIFAQAGNSKKVDCSKIDSIIQKVDEELKYSKIYSGLEYLLNYQKNISDSQIQIAELVELVQFTKNLKQKDPDLQKILIQKNLLDDIKKKMPSKAELRIQAGNLNVSDSFNMITNAFVQIKAASKMQNQLEQLQHGLKIMQDEVDLFLSLTVQKIHKPVNNPELLKDQTIIEQCKGKKHVLQPNIYQGSISSSSEEENVTAVKKTNPPQPSPPVVKPIAKPVQKPEVNKKKEKQHSKPIKVPGRDTKKI